MRRFGRSNLLTNDAGFKTGGDNNGFIYAILSHQAVLID